ncbi:fibronectin type III domain-containing protein [Anaerobutyricum hallii]|uniref:fibronectin type III domain-containing protein n=1 Tax=Anaerobutyricum hallii TaxID=39488 RepID=UPI00399CAE8E
MNKKHLGIVALFILCFSFALAGKSAQAATTPQEISASKIAYVDDSGRLVLKFTDFSDVGYTYTVTNEKTGAKTDTAQLASKKGVLTVSLGQLYSSAKTGYKLVLTSKDNTKKLTVHYYTGKALGSYSIKQKSDDSVKASWTVSDKTYTGYSLGMYLGQNSTVAQKQVSAAKTAVSASVAASSLKNARYYTYLIGQTTLDNNKTVYYGQGMLKTFDYVKKPAKVKGVKAVPNANAAKLSWNAVSNASYYTVYKSTKSSSGYKVAKSKCTSTSLKIKGLTGGKKYYFKVVAVSQAGGKTVIGTQSNAVLAKIPVVAGQVRNVQLSFDSKKNLALTWSRTAKATSYHILYKKAADSKYKILIKTKKSNYSLAKLKADTKYNIKVQAVTRIGNKVYLSSKTSKVITVTPRQYRDKNYNKLLASQVRSIGYVGNKCIYTTKKYSTEVKTAFVNYKGYSSKTKYLIWISHYTQQVSIFEGSKGKWKMIRTFICATGTAKNHSPRGVFKITYKEKGWFYTSTKELYVTHYKGRNSFHTRPLWNNGSVQNPTIGKPASHGCVRCYNQDAKYIYDKMPIGTTVVSY